MSVNECAEIVKKADPDRFLAVMAAPPAAREVLFPLYAFNAEISRAPYVTKEPLIAEMRLQWWRDALDEIKEGGAARRHEVITPLADILDPAACDLLDGVAAARRWDIAREPFIGEAQLWTHLEATGGNLIWAAAHLLGAEDERAVRDLGAAHGLANWLTAVPALGAAGRQPLPDDRPEAIRALAEAGLARLGPVSRKARPAALAAWQAGPILKRARSDPGAVLSGALRASPFARRARLLGWAMFGPGR